MILTVPVEVLRDLVASQAAHIFPDGRPLALDAAAVSAALDRLEPCIASVAAGAFERDGSPCFNHLHSDQYAMFLYLLANTIHKAGGPRTTCEKLFLLNKTLYGIDAFYEVQLPRIFLFCHASGTVLGRAVYGDYFLVYQHCTVGSARTEKGAGRGVFPVLGRHVSLYAGASVLGASTIGDNCKISAHALVVNRSLKANTIYRGTPGAVETATFVFPDNTWRPE